MIFFVVITHFPVSAKQNQHSLLSS
jgi:hypothetical protein